MKRLALFLIILSILVLLPQCAASPTTSIDPDATDENGNPLYPKTPISEENSLIEMENGYYVLIFETCNRRVRVRNFNASWFDRVNDDLIRQADKLIAQDIPPDADASIIFDYDEGEGKFYVFCEIIEKIDPPNTENGPGGGCGIDHEHIIVKRYLE